MNLEKAVILTSGGLDSTTCLAMALHQGLECHTIAFNYGQRHQSELNAAKTLSTAMGAKSHTVININMRSIGGSALTDDIDVPDYDPKSKAIPATYVPARNTVFLSFALGLAETLDADYIYTGVSSVDYSGYPDCRPEYIQAYENMANLATKRAVEGQNITIKTPLLYLSKAQTIEKGLALGVDYSQTVSCYSANEEGLACGRCDSCMLRKKGFADLNQADPTRYRTL